MSATEAHPALQYLTVQDMLWINLQLTKVSHAFSFDKLEEATFGQYGYGGSRDVLRQAAGFLKGFVGMKPFLGKSDDITAFIGTVAFLAMNGFELDVPATEARAWLDRVSSKQVDVSEAIQQLAKPSDAHHPPTAIVAMSAALAKYATLA